MSSKAAGTRFFKNPAGLRQKRRGNGGNRPDKTNREGAASFGRTLITGFFIGIGAIAPGISGGAIAVIFGLYDRIADAIAHFYRGFREKMRFLLPLCLGGGAGVLLFGQVISWLFAHYNTPVRILFIGLMAGTLPSLFRTAAKEGFRRGGSYGGAWAERRRGGSGRHRNPLFPGPGRLRGGNRVRHHRARRQLVVSADGGRAL